METNMGKHESRKAREEAGKHQGNKNTAGRKKGVEGWDCLEVIKGTLPYLSMPSCGISNKWKPSAKKGERI